MGMEARNGDETAPTMESEFISAKFGPWMIVSRKGRFKGNKERDSPKASSRNIFVKGDEVRDLVFLPIFLRMKITMNQI